MSLSLIKKYFPSLSEKQVAQLTQLDPLYRQWNEKINVISRKDVDHLYERHVLHSLGIAKLLPFKKGTDLLDVGTGGGFPGVPLAILFPECRFHLVDSIGKKITVVHEIAKALELTNVIAEHTRAEQVNNKYDFVISRAVTRMKPFYKWVRHSINPQSGNDIKNGILYLKGGDLTEELRELGKYHRTYQLSKYFEEPFFETKKLVHLPIA